jgi:hypothetical protein
MDHQAFAQLLGNYGEFVGAIAVVLTLVYLALRVRQSNDSLEANTAALTAQTRQVAMEAATAELLQITAMPEIGIALAGTKTLTPSDHVQLDIFSALRCRGASSLGYSTRRELLMHHSGQQMSPLSLCTWIVLWSVSGGTREL